MAAEITCAAGRLARAYFADLGNLCVSRKGHQDFVSAADHAVELLMRERLRSEFPDDAVIGEEHDPIEGTSGFTWVIDPIDGTTNFVSGIPAWTVVLAGVQDGRTVCGVIYDPCHDELFVAMEGKGAWMNREILQIGRGTDLLSGSLGLGYSNRRDARGVVRLIELLLARGGVFVRNASGALSLAYVASGRFLGYIEEHMNAWDCLAGQLLISEAGGRIEHQSTADILRDGGRIVVAAPGVFEEVQKLADSAFKDK
nr:inositol monophosphatase family protein [Primorskyibacter marinus]